MSFCSKYYMKTQILTKETITPEEPYLSAHRTQPESYDAQLAFAVTLIHRESEYYQLNRGAATEELTEDEWTPLDPFQLKEEAIMSLQRCLKPNKRYANGYLLLVKLLYDMGRWTDLIITAKIYTDLNPNDPIPWAYISEAANNLASPGQKNYEQEELAARSRGQELVGKARPGGLFSVFVLLGNHSYKLLQWAWRIRKKVEGEAFLKTLKDEAQLLAEARAANIIDEQNIPESFRDLVPLAQHWGIGDDGLRSYALSRATKKEKEDLLSRVRDRVQGIADWLDTMNDTGLTNEAGAFLYLLSAQDEIENK